LGVHLVKSFMDKMIYQRRFNRNVIKLTKLLD